MMSIEEMKQKATTLPEELRYYRALLKHGIDFNDEGSLEVDIPTALQILKDEGVLPDVDQALTFSCGEDLDKICMDGKDDVEKLLHMGAAAEDAGDHDMVINISKEIHIRKDMELTYLSRCLAVLRNHIAGAVMLGSVITCQNIESISDKKRGMIAAEMLSTLNEDTIDNIGYSERFLDALSESNPMDTLNSIKEYMKNRTVDKLTASMDVDDDYRDKLRDALSDAASQFAEKMTKKDKGEPSTDKDGWEYRIQ